MNSPVVHLMQAGRLDRFFIDGDWVLPDGSDRFAVVSPSTEATLGEIPLGSARDADRGAGRAARSSAGPRLQRGNAPRCSTACMR